MDKRSYVIFGGNVDAALNPGDLRRGKTRSLRGIASGQPSRFAQLP
jgi:hypothetical protein